jgi:hypothetical protein
VFGNIVFERGGHQRPKTKMSHPCQVCGTPVKQSRQKFCGRECYAQTKKGVQPAGLKKEPKGADITKVEDGSVDAGLLLMAITPKPGGGEWSSIEVATVCGVSSTYIRMLEQSAMRKLRAAFMARPELAEFL